MFEYLIQYKEEIFRVLSIFAITMAVVYTLGRMLNILKKDVQKNCIALLTIVSMNTLYSYFTSNWAKLDYSLILWDITLFSALCILLYVLVGFKLYSRADNFLDNKLGKDKKK